MQDADKYNELLSSIITAIISLPGMDMLPGREGGTWLGMVRDGRIGCLLNVPHLAEENLNDLKHRGHLVVNYLRSKLEGLEYAKSIEESGFRSKDFNLVILEPAGDSYKMVVYNQNEKMIKQFTSGIFGVGNSPLDEPFLKVSRGCKRMEQIIESYGSVEKEEELIEALQALMRDEEAFFPDPLLLKVDMPYSEQVFKALSSIFVRTPSNQYGTRWVAGTVLYYEIVFRNLLALWVYRVQ